MDELIIEQLNSSDWQVYRAIRLIALITEPQAFSSTFAREAAYPDEKWQARLQEANEGKSTWMFFARLNGKVVGMTGGYRDEQDLIDHAAQIWGMFVSQGERGKGIGQKLMEALLDRLSQDPDIHLLKLAVNPEQQAAKRLYERFGFVTREPSSMKMGDAPVVQCLEMEKLLNV
jgi:RimJ/RimL family protein N-acetyltransferase